MIFGEINFPQYHLIISINQVMLVHLSLAVCGLVTTSYWAKRAEDTLQINRDKYWAYLLVSVVSMGEAKERGGRWEFEYDKY